MTADLARLAGLLERMERAWRAQLAPIAAVLAPGAALDDAEAAAAAAGVRLPAELAAWYGWHDGTTVPAPERRERREETWLGPGYRFYSLAEAVTARRERLQMAAEWSDLPAGRLVWDDSWFPFTINLAGDTLAADCSVAPGVAAPVRRIAYDDEDYLTPATASVTDVVAVWVRLLEEGLWRYDASAGRWEADFDAMPPEVRASRVA